jgi:hypothetical protein
VPNWFFAKLPPPSRRRQARHDGGTTNGDSKITVTFYRCIHMENLAMRFASFILMLLAQLICCELALATAYDWTAHGWRWDS